MDESGNQDSKTSVGIVACGALARELRASLAALPMIDADVRYLPAGLHNTPRDIPAAVEGALADLGAECAHLFVAYGDCGTAGALDKVIDRFGAKRLPGSHCYSFFLGETLFDAQHYAEPGTFYLTDYLARQFDTLVFKPLGLDRHPELRDDYFGNYTRLVYLAQSDDVKLDQKAREAAARLGLRFERIETGLGAFTQSLTDGLNEAHA